MLHRNLCHVAYTYLAINARSVLHWARLASCLLSVLPVGILTVTHQRAACDATSVHFGRTIRRTDILGCGVDSLSVRSWITILGKLFTTQCNFVLAKRRWYSAAGKETMGLSLHWSCVTYLVVYTAVCSKHTKGRKATRFHKNLDMARKHDRLDAYCFWDKPDVDIRF